MGGVGGGRKFRLFLGGGGAPNCQLLMGDFDLPKGQDKGWWRNGLHELELELLYLLSYFNIVILSKQDEFKSTNSQPTDLTFLFSELTF